MTITTGNTRELNPVRRETDITCQREIKELQAEFTRISYDFQLARKIADGTSCAKNTKKTNFMQSCMKIHQNGVKEGYIQFHESSQQHQLMTLMQTEYGRQAMQRGLTEIAGPQALLAPPSMLQVARSRRSRDAPEAVLVGFRLLKRKMSWKPRKMSWPTASRIFVITILTTKWLSLPQGL
mmetsp:Transcript_49332/g.111899  ORF Transcript_49332/g.111899 Transcript_49332/m.111899 type:complete len:181 (-) Transcript_49332:357-899(-)